MSVTGVQDVEISVDDGTATVTVVETVDPAKVAGALTGQFTGTVRRP